MTAIFAVTFVMSAVLICKWTLSHYDYDDDDDDCSIFWVPPIISERGKATNFKLCMHIHRIDRIIGTKVHYKCREQ